MIRNIPLELFPVIQGLFCVMLLLYGAVNLGAEETKRTSSVCEILSAPVKHANKIVEIEGEFVSGRHGVFLIDRQCTVTAKDLSPSICVVEAGDLDAPAVSFKGQSGALRTIGAA